VAVVTESSEEPFAKGNFEYLFSMLHEAWRRLLTEDILSQTVKEIDRAVEAFANTVEDHEGITKKLADVLGIQGTPDKKVEVSEE
jgi:hypothetical protein